MLTELLLPKATSLQVERIEPTETKMVLGLLATTSTAVCPTCQTASDRPHSYYYRFPADLPFMGMPVRLQIRVRRFFCHNEGCQKQTFAEQFPALLATRARRTQRLKSTLEQIAFEVSAESGARLLAWVGIEASPDQLLGLIRATPEVAVETPRVLGVDDWAKRKGRSYGTILIDLEAHRVVDVLLERSAEAVETWLQEHPGVEIISRDRGNDYIKGITAGAPNAVQVADRWHLLSNLREAAELLLTDKPACLKAAADKPEVVQTELATTTETAGLVENAASVQAERAVEGAAPTTKAEVRKQARHARKQERFDLVRQLHDQGLSDREISRQMKMSTRTISKYLQADSCPFYPEGVRRGNSKLDAYWDYLEQRWQAGCHNATQLWREIGQKGFDGSRGLVAKWAAQERRLLPKTAKQPSPAAPRPKKVVPWSVSRTAWLLVKPEAEMDEEEQLALERVKQADDLVAQAHQFVHAFQQMVREKQPEKLESWIAAVTASGIEALSSFAHGLKQDFDAVQNALSYPWSNGQTEGQVNRLKFVKRQMFGRAKFDLLRRHVLGHPAGRSSPVFT
ncbi:MAG: ISL3 family transposase [Chloroflexi bacterium]|nr:ISL3 family transposase [Acidobacteriota bacterium]MCI0574903.1 ISL3 family transposase [Chloroflexota bacterium]MCI0727056.1 ISL3 family transposase [Chloroflexota bacterium]